MKWANSEGCGTIGEWIQASGRGSECRQVDRVEGGPRIRYFRIPPRAALERWNKGRMDRARCRIGTRRLSDTASRCSAAKPLGT